MKYVKINGAVATAKITATCDVTDMFIIKSELNTALGRGCTEVDVDFSDTTLIDSATVNELTAIRRKVGKENFSVRHPQGMVLKLLQASDLMDWVKNEK